MTLILVFIAIVVLIASVMSMLYRDYKQYQRETKAFDAYPPSPAPLDYEALKRKYNAAQEREADELGI
jgi:hypothetical protein